jgi:hypothetical protein
VSHSNRSSLTALLALWLVVVTAATAAVEARENDPIGRAHELVQVFFPDLIGKGYQMLVFMSDPLDNQWTTIDFIKEFGLEIAETRGGFHKGQTSETIGMGLLEAYYEFEADGRLTAVRFTGRANQYREYAAVRALVDLNREWSDDQVLATLREHGASFGPDRKDAFLKTLPQMRSLAGVLGGSSRLASVEFSLRSKDFAGTTYAELNWEVELEVQEASSGERVKYTAEFEPFTGKLVSINKGFIHRQ